MLEGQLTQDRLLRSSLAALRELADQVFRFPHVSGYPGSHYAVSTLRHIQRSSVAAGISDDSLRFAANCEPF